ncbi:DUF2259 domain-containing protein [Candidatus Parabeggiatoa sp. HSG14]|uniref:DUF2259 domain-containing protein n=1 Tax=Candidatus Parabeggiatoa sp. HSG14 TaxID=3055593 RepID=UPI0025A6BF91|nr:DUF2259 domain-containing protein [Thiotrichales bacterium HSG14]
MLKRFIMALALLVSFCTSSFAAGEGKLNMLGFSSDSQFFVLIESVIEDGSGIPTAKIIIADIATNECVRSGCFSKEGSEEEDDELQVLSKVYQKTWKLRKKLKLTPPRIGYQAKGPLFDKERKTNYYVYDNQKIYVDMQQKTMPGPDEFYEKAAVQLTVSSVSKKDKVKKVLDSLSNYRQGVQKYELGNLYVSPDKKSIAILVRVFYLGFEGADIRTIVQTAKLF